MKFRDRTGVLSGRTIAVVENTENVFIVDGLN